jgi:hypothetical protein
MTQEQAMHQDQLRQEEEQIGIFEEMLMEAKMSANEVKVQINQLNKLNQNSASVLA